MTFWGREGERHLNLEFLALLVHRFPEQESCNLKTSVYLIIEVSVVLFHFQSVFMYPSSNWRAHLVTSGIVKASAMSHFI